MVNGSDDDDGDDGAYYNSYISRESMKGLFECRQNKKQTRGMTVSKTPNITPTAVEASRVETNIELRIL